MTAAEDLAEVSARAVRAEVVARSVRWHDRRAVSLAQQPRCRRLQLRELVRRAAAVLRGSS
jgi:hypothetical protein